MTVRDVNVGQRCIALDADGLLGSARVTISLRPSGRGTEVTLVENPAGRLVALRFFPPAQWVICARNAEAARRLRRLAVRRATGIA